MKMVLSIFDDDDKRMAEIDERCKDSRRLGYFFKPWFWDMGRIVDMEKLYDHIDIEKLKSLSNDITWLKFDNYIHTKSLIEIDNRNWIAHYISLIVLNQYIVSDAMYDNIKNKTKLKMHEFSYHLKDTNDILLSILKECCEPRLRNALNTSLYITQSNLDGNFILTLLITHPRYEQMKLKFEYINAK